MWRSAVCLVRSDWDRKSREVRILSPRFYFPLMFYVYILLESERRELLRWTNQQFVQ